MTHRLLWLFLPLSVLLTAAPAAADTTHVVGPGHTLQKIARRYHTSIETLREANGLVPGQKLKLGQRLVIPEVDRPASISPRNAKTGHASSIRDEEYDSQRDDKPARPGQAMRSSYAKHPRRPAVVTLLRGGEQWSGKTVGRGGRALPGVAESFRRLLRDSDTGAGRAIDPRLITLVTQISDHFGGRPVEIVSGYRPHIEGQQTAHSNHNVGRAIDFVVRGVPNDVLRDYCHTLHNVGVGYYPNSSFVHLDVRNATTHWVDESGPGEAPRYTAITTPDAPPRDPRIRAKTAADGHAPPSENPASQATQPDVGEFDVTPVEPQ